MTLTFKNNDITLFDTRNGYSFASDVPFQGDIVQVCDSLLSWCGSRMVDGEAIANVVIEQAEQITAAVSVACSKGERTFVVAQDELPEQLAATLEAAWESLKA
jgi:hypothetical protein